MGAQAGCGHAVDTGSEHGIANIVDVLAEEGYERLSDVLRDYDRLQNMTPKELVDLTLEHMHRHVSDSHFEQVIEELCSRVHPGWENEDPTPNSSSGETK